MGKTVVEKFKMIVCKNDNNTMGYELPLLETTDINKFHTLATMFDIGVYKIEGEKGKLVYTSPNYIALDEKTREKIKEKARNNEQRLVEVNNLSAEFALPFSCFKFRIKRATITDAYYKNMYSYIGSYLSCFIVCDGIEIPFKLENFISENNKGLYKSFMKMHTPSNIGNNAIFEKITAIQFSEVVKYYIFIKNEIRDILNG